MRSHFVDQNARYGHLQIIHNLRSADPTLDGDAINKLWWQDIWHGHLTADTLTPLRQGLLKNFKSSGGSGATAIRSARRRARAVSTSWPGNWQLTTANNDNSEPDALTELEDNRERVHTLLDRYGVVTRELANRDGGPLRWRELFRALRIMELSGEVLQGLFFEGMSGPQFISQTALTRLQQNEKPPEHFWCSAMDAISPCGLGLDWPHIQQLPQRRPQNFMAFYQGNLALVIENLGQRLTFYVDPQHEALDQILAPCIHIAQTRKKLKTSTINTDPARTSPFVAALSRVMQKRSDHKDLYFEV